MWSGRSEVASVCLRCRLRINPRLLPPASSFTYSYPRHARAQSTATAVVEETGEGEHKIQNLPTPYTKPKKPHRWSWKPPRVAKLGIESLGKPAQVLILQDRDRRVPASREGEAEGNKVSEPRILDTLQAENLPLSSENVKQSLDQISAPYRKQSKTLLANQRAELKKKIVDGFTLQQLQSFCISGDRDDLANATTTQVGKSKAETHPEVRPGAVKRSREEKFLAAMATQRGKAGLVEYILKHMWSIPRPDNEEGEERVAISPKKSKYVLTHMQSSLKDYALQFNVVIDTSKDGRNIRIKGGLNRVSAAQEAIDLLLKDVEVSPVRSFVTGQALKDIATSTFVENLTKTYKVVIAWASELYKDISPHEDRLNICYHKTQHLEDAWSAEREILLAERRLAPRKAVTPRENRISMWLPAPGTLPPTLVPHQAPKESNSRDRLNAWARWVLPQQPTGLLDFGPNDPVAESPNVKILQKFFWSLNKQIGTLHESLSGKNDEFFSEMKAKFRLSIRKFLATHKIKASGKIKEEIFVHFGRIAFSQGNMTLNHDFQLGGEGVPGKLFRGKGPASTLMISDLPGLPNYLRSLAPLDDAGSKPNRATYRLRYVPVASGLPPGLEAPLVEIDISKHEKPGSTGHNHHVDGAWAIIGEQSHQLLTPAFAVDLGFVRRLKNQLLINDGSNHGPGSQTRSSQKFTAQFERMNGERFPQFLNMIIPLNTCKGRSRIMHPADAEGEMCSSNHVTILTMAQETRSRNH